MPSHRRHPKPSRRVRGIVRRVAQRRRSVLFAATGVLAIAAVGASRLTVDYSVEQFFPADGPERATYDRFKASFPGEDAQVVVLLESTVVERAQLGPASDRISEAFRAVGLEQVRAAVPQPDATQLEGILWGREGRVRSVVGLVPAEDNNDVGRARIEAELSDRLDALDLSGVSWVTSGTPVIRARIANLFARDQTILLGGGILGFLVVLWVTFGGAAPALAALATVLPAYLVTLGVMGFAGRSVTLLTGFTVVVVLVVGLCDVVHVLEGVRRSRERVIHLDEAIVDAFASMAVPCLYTSLTTAVGFAALAFTGVGIVVEFGLLTALAVLLTWVSAMTVLPALLVSRWAPVPQSGGRVAAALSRGVGHARAVAARGRPWGTLLCFLGVAMTAFVGATRLSVDTRLVDDLRSNSAVLEDLRWAQDHGFGVFQLNVFLEDVEAEDLGSGEMVRWVGETEGWLREQALVMAALGPATAMALAPELGRGLVDADAARAQILATVPDVGSGRLGPLMERVEQRLEEVPPPVGRASLTGTVAMAQTFSARLMGSFGPSLVLAVVLITALMMWMFRSVRLGALALLPNLFPLVVLGGALALLGIDLKPSTILVFSIAFGIAVDDSVHLMARYTEARRRGTGSAAAIDLALSEAGPAILLTTVMVTVGFSLLLLSSFQVLALIGAMSMLTAVAALVADLYLFPTLLAGHDRRGGIGIPIGRRLEVRVFFRPGRRLAYKALAGLALDLRRVTEECLGGRTLGYGVMSFARERLATAVIVLLRDRVDGTPLGFTAATLLPVELNGRTEHVLHMGLSMVVPSLQRHGLARLLASLPPAAVLLRKWLRPVWVTNVSQVPAAIGMFGESVADLHPKPDDSGCAPHVHRLIAGQLMTRHRAAFGVGKDARFDDDLFVIRNAYTGGSDDLKKDWSSAQRHRDDCWNEFCRARLDYHRGDDVLQVGRMTVGQTARVLGRFLNRALHLRRCSDNRRRPAISAPAGRGVG